MADDSLQSLCAIAAAMGAGDVAEGLSGTNDARGVAWARMMRGYGVIERGVLWYRRADAMHRRLDRARREFVSAYLDRALTMDEKERLGAAIYDASLGHRSDPGELFDWERDWYAAELPPPPARILVGAAGAGREVKALVAMGYIVDAFEPAEKAAQRCREHVGPGGDVVMGSYDDLVSGQLPFSAREYDAVILGWGSLSHVLAAGGQEALIHRCADLAPRGAILASFWVQADGPRAVGRACRWGLRLGAGAGKVRGISRPGTSHGDHLFAPWAGFSAPLAQGTIDALAAAVGRDFRWNSEGHGYPRGAFVRR